MELTETSLAAIISLIVTGVCTIIAAINKVVKDYKKTKKINSKIVVKHVAETVKEIDALKKNLWQDVTKPVIDNKKKKKKHKQ